jgi:glycosyltransferase involved in cell wall biosynthesis
MSDGSRPHAPVLGTLDVNPDVAGVAPHGQASRRAPLTPGVSVVIPVYNSEAVLRTLVSRLEPVLQGLTGNYELLLVNDGSRDGSWAVVQELVRAHGWIRGINLMRNYGQHNALLCGIRAASYDVTVTLDDDLQHPPEEIGKLLARLHEGFDVVYGVPLVEQHGLWRDLASQVTKIVLQKAMGAEIARNVSAFRAFRTELRRASTGYGSPFVSVDVLLTWGTSSFSALRVRHDPRTVGVSNYSFGKLFVHALNMLTGFSTWPLHLASIMGFTLTLFGIGLLLLVVIRYLMVGTPVPGFPFLASTVAIFSGAQLFALGIMGEYLARLHFRMLGRPTYVVGTMTPDPEE